MKEIRNAGRIILMLSLCVVLILLAGCGNEPPMDTIEVEPADLAEDDCLAVTLVNASGDSVGSVYFEWFDERDQDYRLNVLPGDDTLEPDGVLQILLPKDTDSYYCMPCDSVDGLITGFYLLDRSDMEDGSILVLPPADNSYGLQIIFAPGTDVETAKETTLAAYQEFSAAEQESTLSSEEITAAVQQLGYDSLADMRTQEHPDLGVSIDYYVYPEEEPNRDIYELYGYWYPEGDRNSLEYFSISDEGVQWYSFDPEKGDVLTDSQRITSRILKTYNLSDGRSFTVGGSVVAELITGLSISTGSLCFDDDSTEYSFSQE